MSLYMEPDGQMRDGNFEYMMAMLTSALVVTFIIGGIATTVVRYVTARLTKYPHHIGRLALTWLYSVLVFVVLIFGLGHVLLPLVNLWILGAVYLAIMTAIAITYLKYSFLAGFFQELLCLIAWAIPFVCFIRYFT